MGTILVSIPACAEMYHLPKLVAPTLLLSLGYPKGLAARRRELDYNKVVFEGDYPSLSFDEICSAYDAKYQGMKTTLPTDSERRQAWLSEFKRALLTTYNETKSTQVFEAADAAGSKSENQRRFGLHYHAKRMHDPMMFHDLGDEGIYPFYSF